MPLLPCCVVFSQTHIGHDKEQGPKEIKNGKGFPHAGVNSNCKCTGEGLVKNLSGSLVV